MLTTKKHAGLKFRSAMPINTVKLMPVYVPLIAKSQFSV